ncbi:MAG TPA: flagellin [Hyphomonadaceae bacterium]|nr:flagellin [Hyphomonadaceae bacterium]HPN06791.1 flagellin [Hyphomonadaceae bacterium]
MVSVNTNYSAMIALQNLNFTNTELEGVQNKVSTGLKISSARDNGAIYAIAEGQRSRVSSVAAVRDGIDRANSTIDVALAAGKSIGDILQKLMSKAVAAQADDLTTTQRSALQADFSSLRNQIDVIANSAQFNGANLAADSFVFNVMISDLGGASDTLVINGLDMTMASTDFSAFATIDISASAADAETAADAIKLAITNHNISLASLGSQATALDAQNEFLSKLSDEIENGIGNLVDADLAKESAKLQSLQIKQQLGTQALSIANQAPQVLLSLFRS